MKLNSLGKVSTIFSVQYVLLKLLRKKAFFWLQKNPLLSVVSLLFFTPLGTTATLYEIAVEPAKIYKDPVVNQHIVHSLYTASNIKIVKQQGNWVLITFNDKGKKLTGWIQKNQLLAQPLEEDIKAKEIISSNINGEGQQLERIRPHNVFSKDNAYGVKIINSDLACVNLTDSVFISGCLLNIDLEIIGPSVATSVAVMCKAEFEMNSEGQLSHLWEQKIIRTPLKEGVGAARIELAIIPFLEKKVTGISIQSHQCRLERVFSTSN